jgi:hypothetical protein
VGLRHWPRVEGDCHEHRQEGNFIKKTYQEGQWDKLSDQGLKGITMNTAKGGQWSNLHDQGLKWTAMNTAKGGSFIKNTYQEGQRDNRASKTRDLGI